MANLGILLASIGVGLSVFLLLNRSIEHSSKPSAFLAVSVALIYGFLLFVYYLKI